MVAHCGLAIDAQALRFAVHGNKQKTHLGIDKNFAETLETCHSRVIVGEGEAASNSLYP